jgi:hypothetical protein
MMNTNVSLGVNGAFKVDFYKSGCQEIQDTTDWFSNFITPTGMMCPLRYAFADCFRYLSLGASSADNFGSQNLGDLGTTGLGSPISQYKTTNASPNEWQNGQYIDWRGYASGVDSTSSCGTILNNDGLRLYRSWHIPTGGPDVYINADEGQLTIEEFMVSPSSGSDSYGKSAFSRVKRNISIPNGYRVIISYQLKINTRNTGVQVFSAGAFSTGGADVETDADLVRGWGNLSGYYRQVYHGLRCIDNYGLTYIPKFGDIMEPASKMLTKSYWYLSPDNSQFDINTTSGGAQTSVSSSYKADGLMSTVKDINFRIVSQENTNNIAEFFAKDAQYVDNKPSDDYLYNIRVGESDGASLRIPQLSGYKTNSQYDFNYQLKAAVDDKSISYATPGVKGFNTDSYVDFGKKYVSSSSSIQIPFSYTGLNTVTGRKKIVTRKAFISPVSSLGYNTRFGSMVYVFDASDDGAVEGEKLYYPCIDTLFFDSSGRSLMPHYRFITGIAVSSRGTGVIDGQFVLSGRNGSVYKFVSRSGFYGPYSASPQHNLLNQVVWTKDSIDKYAGLYASGNLDSNSYGYTGNVTANLSGGGGSFTSTKGYGALYGLEVNSGFWDLPPDLGLANHAISGNLSEPPVTGQLYWPMVFGGNELNFSYTGLKYYHPDVVEILPDTGWFGKNQIIRNINFESVESGNYTNITTPGGFVKNVTGTASSPFSGYFLTNKQFTGNQITVASDVLQTPSAVLSGYIVSNGDSPGKLYGTTWLHPSFPPSNSMSFLPQATDITLAGTSNCRKITGLWANNITSRGYPAGSGSPFCNSDSLRVAFTGIYLGSPIYLTYVSGIANNVSGNSFLSGTVSLTDFSPPKLYPIHQENYGSTGWKLAPNFSEANYYGSDIYTASAGGEYPALSFDNGLEVYLDISWQSDCGAAKTCNSPP